jgi:DNA-binding XRE family transcriptional regulator
MENRIYQILRQKNMTQGELDKIVGVKLEYINRIIHGKVTPRIPLGLRIANALQVPMEDLFFIEAKEELKELKEE